MNVFVTNNSSEVLEAKYHGIQYRLPIGEPVEMPEEAASFILGYGVKDRYDQVVRLGWALLVKDVPAALERLDKFEFSLEKPTKEEPVSSPLVEQVPPTAAKRGRRGGTVLQAVA